jgi:hypothetical protein
MSSYEEDLAYLIRQLQEDIIEAGGNRDLINRLMRCYREDLKNLKSDNNQIPLANVSLEGS